MKIVWRNPNWIPRRVVSIVKTGSLEATGALHLFYRSSAGPGVLGTLFEVHVNRGKLSHAA